MRNRKEEIKEKGFRMTLNDTPVSVDNENNNFVPLDFNKIKVGMKTIQDATFQLGTYGQIDSRFLNKKNVLDIIYNNDYSQMRELSRGFFKISGIYYKNSLLKINNNF